MAGRSPMYEGMTVEQLEAALAALRGNAQPPPPAQGATSNALDETESSAPTTLPRRQDRLPWPQFPETQRRSRADVQANLRDVVAEWESRFSVLQRHIDRASRHCNTVVPQLAALLAPQQLNDLAGQAPGEWLKDHFVPVLRLTMTALMSSLARHLRRGPVSVLVCTARDHNVETETERGATTVLFSHDFHLVGQKKAATGIVRRQEALLPEPAPTWDQVCLIANVAVAGDTTILGDCFHFPADVRVWQLPTDPSRVYMVIRSFTFPDNDPLNSAACYIPVKVRLFAAVVFFLAHAGKSVLVSVAGQNSELYEATVCDGGLVLLPTNRQLRGTPPPPESTAASVVSSKETEQSKKSDTTRTSQPGTEKKPTQKLPQIKPNAPRHRSDVVDRAVSIAEGDAWHDGVLEELRARVMLRSAVGMLQERGWTSKAIAVAAGYSGHNNGRNLRVLLEQRCMDAPGRLERLRVAAGSLLDALPFVAALQEKPVSVTDHPPATHALYV